MRTTIENNILTIFLDGRIDTTNAAETERELLAAIEGRNEDIVVDAGALEYISSAGLRVLMKLRKTIKRELPIINVSRDVYDIFETTGFTEMFDVKKALREISTEGCEVVGEGSYGTVYRLDSETILKEYRMGSKEFIERERFMSQRAFVNGLPTAISYDVVKVGDHYGVVYELLDANTVSQIISADPDNKEKIVRLAISELKRFHSIEIDDELFEDKKKPMLELFEKVSDHLDPEERELVFGYLDSIPERKTFCHGDYNFKNVMCRDGEILLIDIGDAGIGHPIFDLAGLALAYPIYAKSGAPVERIIRFLGFEPSLADDVWKYIVSEYFNTNDPAMITHYTDMLLPMAELTRAYHVLRRAPDLNDRQAVSADVDKFIRGLSIPRLRNAPKIDF